MQPLSLIFLFILLGFKGWIKIFVQGHASNIQIDTALELNFSIFPIDKNHYFQSYQIHQNDDIEVQIFQTTIIYHINHHQSTIIALVHNVDLFPKNITQVSFFINQYIVNYSFTSSRVHIKSYIFENNKFLQYDIIVTEINIQAFIKNHLTSMIYQANLISANHALPQNLSQNQPSLSIFEESQIFTFQSKDFTLQYDTNLVNYLEACLAFNLNFLGQLPILIDLTVQNNIESLLIDTISESQTGTTSILIDCTNCTMRSGLQVLNYFNRILIFALDNYSSVIKLRGKKIYFIDLTLRSYQTIEIESELLFINKVKFIGLSIKNTIFQLNFHHSNEILNIEMVDTQIVSTKFQDNVFFGMDHCQNDKFIIYLSSTSINNSSFKNFSLFQHSISTSTVNITDLYISNSIIESSNFIVSSQIYINNLIITNCTIIDSTLIKSDFQNLQNITITNSKLIRVNTLVSNSIKLDQMIIQHTQIIDSCFIYIQNKSMMQVTEEIKFVQDDQFTNVMIKNTTYECQSFQSFINIQAYFVLFQAIQILDSLFQANLFYVYARQIVLNDFQLIQSSIMGPHTFITIKSNYIYLQFVLVQDVFVSNCSNMINVQSLTYQSQSQCNITELSIINSRIPSIIYIEFQLISLTNITLWSQEFDQINFPQIYLFGLELKINNLNYYSFSNQTIFIIFCDKFLFENSIIMSNQSNYFSTINSLNFVIRNCQFTQTPLLFELINTLQTSSQLQFENNQIYSSVKAINLGQYLVSQSMIIMKGKYSLINIVNNTFNINELPYIIFQIINVNQLLLSKNKARIPQNFISAATLFLENSMTCIANQFTQSQTAIIQKQCTLIQFNLSNVTIQYLNVNHMACNVLELIDSRSISIFKMNINKVNITASKSLIDIYLSYFTEVQILITDSNFSNINLIQNEDSGPGLLEIYHTTNMSIEFHKISIQNVNNAFNKQSLVNLFANNFLNIDISALTLKNSNCGHSCLSIIVISMEPNDNQLINGQQYLLKNSLIYNNSGFYVMRLGNIDFQISNTTLFANLNQQLSNSFSANLTISYSELYCDILCSYQIQLTKSYKTYVATLDTLQHDAQMFNQLRFSINQGYSFLKNKMISSNTYQIQYYKSTKQYFYIPTGQYFTSYQRLNYSSYSFSPYNLKFYLKFVDSYNIMQNLTCQMLIYSKDTEDIIKTINFSTGNQKWDDLLIIIPQQTIITFNIKCQFKQLLQKLTFFVKPFPCQMGEFQLDNQCLRCSELKQHYSVQKHSQICKIIDPQTTMYVNSAFLNLKQGYWRPQFKNDQIEKCNLRWRNCEGGLDVGDKMCAKGYIGAACSECDLFDFKGLGKFVKSNSQGCILCSFEWKDLYKLVLILLLQIYIILLVKLF